MSDAPRRPVAPPADPRVVSQVRFNAERDPTYRPYCLRCSTMVRMQIVEPFYWRCGCGAEHDERTPAPLASSSAAVPDLSHEEAYGDPGGLVAPAAPEPPRQLEEPCPDCERTEVHFHTRGGLELAVPPIPGEGGATTTVSEQEQGHQEKTEKGQLESSSAREATWVPVEFQGRRLWIEAEVLTGLGRGALAPEEHVIDGRLDPARCFGSDTFAHVYDGHIRRYGVEIGTVADLKPRAGGDAPEPDGAPIVFRNLSAAEAIAELDANAPALREALAALEAAKRVHPDTWRKLVLAANRADYNAANALNVAELDARWTEAILDGERLRATVASLTAERDALAEDVRIAAGECLVPIPAPGSDMSRVMLANRQIARERDALAAKYRDACTAIARRHNNADCACTFCEDLRHG